MKKVRVGINGFGRIGRIATRIALARPGIEIVAINSRADSTSHAYLLKYDTTYGIFPHVIETKPNQIVVDKKPIQVFQVADPSQIPWKKAEVDIVVEATGAFRRLSDAQKHLSSGAKRVVVSAPPKDAIPTFCMGVNHHRYDPKTDRVISNASCTTNCLATVAKVLHDSFTITKGFMTTTHAYTDSQNLLDNSHKKSLRLGRSAANNIIPSDTGASHALGIVIPDLSGKIISSAIRVPVITGSLIDLTVEVKKKPSVETVNQAFEQAEKGLLRGILALSYDPLVSSDIRGSSLSALVDEKLTQVFDQMINVKAWYDNEWGYSTRLIDLVEYVASKGI